jgi:FeS assembly SUF system protein
MSDIRVEEVDSVTAPPKARVDDAESAPAKLERKKDYLEGFLAQKPVAPATDQPDGDLYEAVIAALKDIYDPEIPVNIYDLGLIYNVEINDGHAVVTMTLTTPHCPVAESMPAEVELRVGSVPGIGDAEVNLVWEPAWDPAKMSDEARLELGMLSTPRRGCSGLAYSVDYVAEAKPFDEKIDTSGGTLYIDGASVLYLVGSTMDWVENDFTAGFTFNNPNAKGACGCGESFTV